MTSSASGGRGPSDTNYFFRSAVVFIIVILIMGIASLNAGSKEEDYVIGWGLILVAFLFGFGLFKYLTAHVVPPGTIGVHKNLPRSDRNAIIKSGDRYAEYEDYTWHTLEPRTSLLGPHIITWKPSEDNFLKYLDCAPISEAPYTQRFLPVPVRNFWLLWMANKNVDLYEYAPMYGVEIMKIDPPLNSVSPPKGVFIGTCFCHNETVPLLDEDRKQHAYIAGKTKSGKSTLLLNMAIQDIQQGKGVAFIDPHGDTVQRLLDLIPRARAKDVIYISGDRPAPLNIMEARTDTEREILQDDIYTLLRGMSDTWGERMDAILTNTLAALFSAKHCSFIDIYNFLADPAIRQRILKRVDNEAILRFWANYHPPNYPRGAEQPILSRMEKFVTRPTLAAILGAQDGGIDLYDVMQSGKILLVDTSRRSMGQHTGAVLGGLIVTKLYQTAMRRADIAESQRKPFYVYVDEFQSFIASDIQNILSETRKYGISLTLAHQYLSQISEATRKGIFGNVGTMIYFQLGYDDAKYLSHQVGQFEVNDILNLSIETHEALVRPDKGSAHTYKIRTLPPAREGESFKATILNHQPKHDAPPAAAEPDEDEEDDDDFLESPYPEE